MTDKGFGCVRHWTESMNKTKTKTTDSAKGCLEMPTIFTIPPRDI